MSEYIKSHYCNGKTDHVYTFATFHIQVEFKFSMVAKFDENSHSDYHKFEKL